MDDVEESLLRHVAKDMKHLREDVQGMRIELDAFQSERRSLRQAVRLLKEENDILKAHQRAMETERAITDDQLKTSCFALSALFPKMEDEKLRNLCTDHLTNIRECTRPVPNAEDPAVR